jgi:hypothetical protein
VKAAFEIVLVSLCAFRVAFRQLRAVFTCQAQTKLLRNLARNLLFHREDVGEPAIVLLTPKMPSVLNVHQFGADHQRVAPLQHATQQYRLNIELPAHRSGVERLVFIAEDGAARHHAYAR